MAQNGGAILLVAVLLQKKSGRFAIWLTRKPLKTAAIATAPAFWDADRDITGRVLRASKIVAIMSIDNLLLASFLSSLRLT